jgi:hypothetical protein
LKYLIQTFGQVLDSVINRPLGLAPGRPFHDNLQLVRADAPLRKRRLQAQPLHEVRHGVASCDGVGDVVAGPALADNGQDAGDLGSVVFASAGFQLHDGAQGQAGGDAVGDAVGRAEGVAHAVAEAEAALHVLAQEAERGEGGKEELGDCVGVVRVGGVRLGEVGEEGRGGAERELFARDFGGRRVVEQFYGVVEAVGDGLRSVSALCRW